MIAKDTGHAGASTPHVSTSMSSRWNSAVQLRILVAWPSRPNHGAPGCTSYVVPIVDGRPDLCDRGNLCDDLAAKVLEVGLILGSWPSLMLQAGRGPGSCSKTCFEVGHAADRPGGWKARCARVRGCLFSNRTPVYHREPNINQLSRHNLLNSNSSNQHFEPAIQPAVSNNRPIKYFKPSPN